MSNDYLSRALACFSAMNQKQVEEAARYLHPEIHFTSPLSNVRGKEDVLETAKGFVFLSNHPRIRAKFASDNQVVIIYDLKLPEQVELFTLAALITFDENLIILMEFFYDPRPILEEKEGLKEFMWKALSQVE